MQSGAVLRLAVVVVFAFGGTVVAQTQDEPQKNCLSLLSFVEN